MYLARVAGSGPRVLENVDKAEETEKGKLGHGEDLGVGKARFS